MPKNICTKRVEWHRDRQNWLFSNTVAMSLSCSTSFDVHEHGLTLVVTCSLLSRQFSSYTRPVRGGDLQVLPIASGLKLLFVAVCGVVSTVLTVRQRLNSSVTAMTICLETFWTMKLTFYINYFQNDQPMTITWDLDPMTARWMSELIINTFWVECYSKTYISHFISHFITRCILFQYAFLNLCNRIFYSTAPPACSLLTILPMAQMYKLYILYFAIPCILYYTCLLYTSPSPRD